MADAFRTYQEQMRQSRRDQRLADQAVAQEDVKTRNAAKKSG